MKTCQIPVSVTISRKDGSATIKWREGTEEEFFRVVEPLVRFGMRMLDEEERKKAHDPKISD